MQANTKDVGILIGYKNTEFKFTQESNEHLVYLDKYIPPFLDNKKFARDKIFHMINLEHIATKINVSFGNFHASAYFLHI